MCATFAGDAVVADAGGGVPGRGVGRVAGRKQHLRLVDLC